MGIKLILATAALALAGTGQTVLGVEYQFDIYRRQGDVIGGFAVGGLRFETDTLTLNNAGTALFLSHGSNPNNPFDYTLHTGDRMVARVGQPLNGRVLNYIEPASVSMNNGGAIAFIANHVNGSPAVYLNGNPALELGAPLGADVLSIIRSDGLELGDHGDVALYAEVNGTVGAVNTGTRAVVRSGAVVGRVGQTIDGVTIRDMNWDAENVTINIGTDATGRVAFFASRHVGGGHDTLFTQTRVLSPFSVGSATYGAHFQTVSLNDGGDYAFVARENDPTPDTTVIRNGTVVARGGVTPDGRPYSVSQVGALELNESGNVAFFFDVAGPNQTSTSALSVDGAWLLRVGDVVDGYTVSQIHQKALGLNDLGETLIAVTLLDGAGGNFEALVYGAPVPEPGAAAACGFVTALLVFRRRRRVLLQGRVTPATRPG